MGLFIAGFAPKGSCQISVAFLPTATGARTGALNITLGDSPFSDSITLNGTGLAQALAVNPANLTLTSVAGSTTGHNHLLFNYRVKRFSVA